MTLTSGHPINPTSPPPEFMKGQALKTQHINAPCAMTGKFCNQFGDCDY